VAGAGSSRLFGKTLQSFLPDEDQGEFRHARLPEGVCSTAPKLWSSRLRTSCG
jgi:hypothetical protein